MKGIHELLNRYKNLTPPDAVVRKNLALTISKEIKREVNESDIKIIGPVAYCRVDGSIKNILFMKKETILNSMEQEFGKGIVKDIQ